MPYLEATVTTINNLVAKHAHKYNKAVVHRCRKKAAKAGFIKHKGRLYGHT